jgi:hypothetical protein
MKAESRTLAIGALRNTRNLSAPNPNDFCITILIEISEKVQKSLITPLPAPSSIGTGAGRQGLGIDYTDAKYIRKSEKSG